MNSNAHPAPRTTLFANQPPVTQSSPAAAVVRSAAAAAVSASAETAAVSATPAPTPGASSTKTVKVYVAGVGHAADARLYYVLEKPAGTQPHSLLCLAMSPSVMAKFREAPRWSCFSIVPNSAGVIEDCEWVKDKDAPLSMQEHLNAKLVREVSTADDFSKCFTAIRVKDRQVLFVFKGEVRLPIASMRRVTSSDKKTPAMQARVELLGAMDFKARALLVAATATQFQFGDSVRANAIKIEPGAMLLIDCSAIGRVVGKLHDVSFEFTNEFPEAPVEYPQRIVLGFVTSCEGFEKRDDRAAGSYSYLVPVSQAGQGEHQVVPVQPPAEHNHATGPDPTTVAAANPVVVVAAAPAPAAVAAPAAAEGADAYYKVALMSLATRSYLNAWCSEEIRPGTLCHLAESVNDKTGATVPVRLLVMKESEDFSEWYRIVTNAPDAHTGLDVLKDVARIPFAPLPLTRGMHLETLVSAQTIQPILAVSEPSEAMKKKCAKVGEARLARLAHARGDKRPRNPQDSVARTVAPTVRPVHGCLPPVWIEFGETELAAAGGTMADVMRVVSMAHDPADILGASGLEDIDFRRPTTNDGYSPTVFLLAEFADVTVLARFVATESNKRAPAAATSWEWHQDGPDIRILKAEVRELFGTLMHHCNPRTLSINDHDGALTLGPFVSWEIDEETDIDDSVGDRRALVTTVSNADLCEEEHNCHPVRQEPRASTPTTPDLDEAGVKVHVRACAEEL